MPTVSLITIDENGKPKLNVPAEKYEVTEGNVLFDELDEQGKELPHGCLAGSCGSCRILVIEGEENLSKKSSIETNTVEDLESEYKKNKGEDFLSNGKVRLACRARVKGDITFGPI